MSIDKQSLKSTLLALEYDVIAKAEAAYEAFVSGARIDREQTVEDDDLAQAVTQRNIAESAESRAHEHHEHIAQIEAIDFGPKTTVEPGAVIKLADSARRLVVATSTAGFVCDGIAYIGISTEAPLYGAMEGLRAGDSFEIANRERTIEGIE